MWGTKCYLCEYNDISDTSKYFCSDCQQYKRISAIYKTEVIRECLEEIFVRQTTPITNRSKIVADKVKTRSQVKFETKTTTDDKKSSN